MMAWQVRAVCACESLDACVNVSVWVWSCQKKEENHKVAVHPRQEEEWQKETTEYETSQVRRGRAKHAGKAPLHPGPKRKDNEFINTFISDNSVTIHKLHVGLTLLNWSKRLMSWRDEQAGSVVSNDINLASGCDQADASPHFPCQGQGRAAWCRQHPGSCSPWACPDPRQTPAADGRRSPAGAPRTAAETGHAEFSHRCRQLQHRVFTHM